MKLNFKKCIRLCLFQCDEIYDAGQSKICTLAVVYKHMYTVNSQSDHWPLDGAKWSRLKACLVHEKQAD